VRSFVKKNNKMRFLLTTHVVCVKNMVIMDNKYINIVLKHIIRDNALKICDIY
jgi:hypothetical protein